ncbi:uncharacterized protein [Rutidosis leptorrhynchoides]|uniref:uncharacterized protein n=1 Tax=Rutidosis leptorrhynchoides TaxID=125765 RepID=UPI003A9A2E90
MKSSPLNLRFYLQNPTNLTRLIPKSPSLIPKTHSKLITISKTSSNQLNNNKQKPIKGLLELKPRNQNSLFSSNNDYFCSRKVIISAVSVGFMLFLMGFDDGDSYKAMAFGPEGPLMEEFWDNVRRYGLYALTVSTGALYAIFQPIYELLKNPISAILVLVIFVGGFFIISQVLSAMVGVSEFDYQYGY